MKACERLLLVRAPREHRQEQEHGHEHDELPAWSRVASRLLLDRYGYAQCGFARLHPLLFE